MVEYCGSVTHTLIGRYIFRSIMGLFQRCNDGLMSLYGIAPFRFILIIYAFMCMWLRLTHDVILSLSTAIDYYSGINLSFIYSYHDVINEISLLDVVIIAPVLETIMFQVVIQNFLRNFIKNQLVILLITAVLFSLIHLSNNVANAVNAFGLGLAFAMIYEYFRVCKNHVAAVFVTIAIHVFWNVTLVHTFI